MSNRIAPLASTLAAVWLLTTSWVTAQETEYDVTLFQHFQSTASAMFSLGPAADDNGFLQMGLLTVLVDDGPASTDEPTDEPTDSGETGLVSELSGNWFQIDFWWFPLWFGVAESESGEFFAIGIPREDRLVGRACLFGDLAVESGRYGFRGDVVAKTDSEATDGQPTDGEAEPVAAGG